MSSQHIPTSSQVAVRLIEMRLPDFIKQAITPLIQIPLLPGQLLIGQVEGSDPMFKFTWTCEISKTAARSKEILIELSYGELALGTYNCQVYAIVPLDDSGVAIDQIRKRKLEVAMKNMMFPALPLNYIASICKELDTLIDEDGAFFSTAANYKIYG